MTAGEEAIAVGDLLTISDIPGTARKLEVSESGPVIGKALEALDEGEGSILVFIEPGHYTAPKDKEIADLMAKVEKLSAIVCLDHPEADICNT